MLVQLAQNQAEAPLTIRFAPMTQRDLVAVSRVDLECFNPPMSLLKIRHLWHLDQRFKWRVLRVNDEMGFPLPSPLTVAYACYADYGGQAHLLKLGCLEAVRGLGLGRWLLLQVLQEMTASGVSEVQLEVRDSNAVARHLYHQHGFREDGIQPRGYPDGEDAVLMSIPQLQGKTVQQALRRQYRFAQAAQTEGSYALEDRHGGF